MYAHREDVAAHLGRPLTISEQSQVDMWIEWLSSDIFERLPAADPSKAQRAIVESIVAYMRNPEGALSVNVQVDDGLVFKRYSSGTGRIELLADWWVKLGWRDRRGAFTIRPHYVPDGHAWR